MKMHYDEAILPKSWKLEKNTIKYSSYNRPITKEWKKTLSKSIQIKSIFSPRPAISKLNQSTTE